MRTERLVVANARGKYLALLLCALAFVAIGALIVLRQPGLGGFLIGGASIAFFGAGAVLFAFQLLDRQPRLILDDDGLNDRTLGVGIIPWRDIADARLLSVRGHAFVCLQLRNPEHWADKLSPRQRRLAALNQRMGYAMLNVNLAGAAVDPQAVLQRILKSSAMYEPGRG
ncbi:hypothetical protein GLE_4396 [Lysobacter enzymogenes]|uniref:Uncharacterized protein n=1 Tax=Lysobacter enzymogenes TaxID=69 RepID=A0A0S2DMV8_LYSEN|nr:STM3941 family protein [Lysobacter enzymogenes]ALN59737.1 hypothetical protein GLE_4396 [Lysobacter enzymogenes]QCW27833.1 hypothetical protein FE772_21475 [Lysobacter enzymogenes]